MLTSTRRDSTVDTLSGVTAPDPYRWLEQSTEEVRSWQDAQRRAAREHLDRTGRLPWMRDLVEQATPRLRRSAPQQFGDRWLQSELDAARRGVRVSTWTQPGEQLREVFHAADGAAEHPPTVTWWSASPDGRTLAVGLCPDGSERTSLVLLDIESGARLPAPALELADSWTGGVQWLRDSSGFFVTALHPAAGEFEQRIFRCTLGQADPVEPEDVPLPAGLSEYLLASVALDGRWVLAQQGLMTPRPVAVLDLHESAPRWRPFVDTVEGMLAGHVLDDHLVAITDVDAPNGRIVVIPLDATDPNDVGSWVELLPQSDAVLRSLQPVAGHLYVHALREAWSELQVLDAAGRPAGLVPLPAKGVVLDETWPLSWLSSPRGGTRFTFQFSTLVSSWMPLAHSPGAPSVERLAEPEKTVAGAVVEERSAVSSDGATVLYRVVRPPGATGAGPVLISAYGGYNVCWNASYPNGQAAWVAAGGTFVHAHLRGGGELGQRWWHEGRMQRKQQCYDDLYAVAEDLIASGIADPARLALNGGSNGGLMCGVAVTQRPELFRAVAARAPLLDLIGACRERYGRLAVSLELGDPDDPDDVRRLLGISPYQCVLSGTAYPAVFLEAGANDPRCPPWHARKLAAALQHATSSGQPVLLDVWEGAGHGQATQREVEVEQHAAWLTFLADELGLDPETERDDAS